MNHDGREEHPTREEKVDQRENTVPKKGEMVKNSSNVFFPDTTSGVKNP